MRIRRYTPADADKVDEIYFRCHGHFALPDIKNCVEMAIVEDDDGDIVAFGAFELIPELTLVLDTDKRKRDQIIALKNLLHKGQLVAKLNDFKAVYVFPDSNMYADVLKKHFGFEDTNPILVKKVGSDGR